ncbi:hypothetical protein [Aeoliella sp.]|uniref:hypothetical protein n=1 Tax=Aeoliella sp. TaxID=2795800 RepID=UPI003CCC361A
MSDDNNPFESPRAVSAGAAPAGGGGTYAPCPSCASTSAKSVKFTWWGGVVGAKMFSHVKCLACGAGYNGKTGKSNLVPIIIYQVVGLLIALLIILAMRG